MDELINPQVVLQLRALVRRIDPSRALGSLGRAERSVVDRRLRQRVDIVRYALLADLPVDLASTKQVVGDLLTAPDFSGWCSGRYRNS